MDSNEFISFQVDQFSLDDTARSIAVLDDNAMKFISLGEEVDERERLIFKITTAPFAGAEAKYKTQAVWFPDLNDPNTAVTMVVNLNGISYMGKGYKNFRANVERTLTPEDENSWEVYEYLAVSVHNSASVTNAFHLRKREPASWWRINNLFPDDYYTNCDSLLVWDAYNRPASL